VADVLIIEPRWKEAHREEYQRNLRAGDSAAKPAKATETRGREMAGLPALVACQVSASGTDEPAAKLKKAIAGHP
jgi:hypothetical protein